MAHLEYRGLVARLFLAGLGGQRSSPVTIPPPITGTAKTSWAGSVESVIPNLENSPLAITTHICPIIRAQVACPTLDTDSETMNGSLFIIEAKDMVAAETFVTDDPYGQAGLFGTVAIRPLPMSSIPWT